MQKIILILSLLGVTTYAPLRLDKVFDWGRVSGDREVVREIFARISIRVLPILVLIILAGFEVFHEHFLSAAVAMGLALYLLTLIKTPVLD